MIVSTFFWNLVTNFLQIKKKQIAKNQCTDRRACSFIYIGPRDNTMQYFSVVQPLVFRSTILHLQNTGTHIHYLVHYITFGNFPRHTSRITPENIACGVFCRKSCQSEIVSSSKLYFWRMNSTTINSEHITFNRPLQLA